jgi:uncharacterized protein
VIRRHRLATAILAVVFVLVAVNVADRFGPRHTGLVVGPVVALLLVVLARRAGLSWDELGMSRRNLAKGGAYAAAAVAVVAIGYAAATLLPITRAAFLDVRYHLPAGRAMVSAFVVVPLGTVLLEEIAFRGVLLALVHRHRGMAWATVVSSVLFGLWHILPSLRLGRANSAMAASVGPGPHGQVLAILVAVAFTTLAGLILCELRRRSGSLLAAAGLHWATNGLGVVLATVMWASGTG